jgi:uncharacterized membrane-anchored protein
MPDLDAADSAIAGVTDAPVPGWLDHVAALIQRHERSVLMITVISQVAFLGALGGWRGVTLWSGRTVLLRVVPVDPRDLLRGDYVTLGYDISTMWLDGVSGALAPGRPDELAGRTVYVTLVPEADGRHFRRGALSWERPPSGTTFIKGTVANQWRIRFGIESYFVQEGKGKEYEQAIRNHHVSAEIALSASGDAVLRRLVIE